MNITYQEFRTQQKYFPSSDGRLAYIDKGAGPVVLLLHGVPTSSWLYRKMIDPIVAQGFRVIAPDMLGFGNSGNPKGYEIYQEREHAKRLLELLDHLEIKHWFHVSHDAGGLWTWELMKQRPDAIQRLILLNTVILEAGFNPPMRMEKGRLTQLIMWLYRNGITTHLLLKMLFKNGLLQDDLSAADIQGYQKPLLEGKTRALYYFFSQTCLQLPDYTSLLEKINLPVAVIWGEKDDMLQWEPQALQVAELLDIKAENIHLLQAKHFIPEGVPKQVLQYLLDFIKD